MVGDPLKGVAGAPEVSAYQTRYIGYGGKTELLLCLEEAGVKNQGTYHSSALDKGN